MTQYPPFAVREGLIDVITSAHAPAPAEDKRRPFSEATPGAIGLETLLPAALTLHHEAGLVLLDVLRPLTTGPASLLIDELAASDGVRGCLCLGYPFHPPGKPLQLRTEHLAALQTPTLILQGERDTFGRREEVETYSLSPQVQLRWIPSGDHSFKPSRSSGLSQAENWATAVDLGDRFMRERLLC